MLAATLLPAVACATIANPSGWSGPQAVGDLILVSDEGTLKAIQVEDDSFREKWRFPDPNRPEDEDIDPEGIYGTPVAAAGVVYFGAYDDNVYALDLEDGELVWDEPFATDGPVIGGVALNGRDEEVDTVFAGSDDGNLYAIDARSGREKDRFDAGDSIWAPPLFDQGIVYVATLGDKLFALDAKTLDEIWDKPFEAEAGLVSTPVLADEETLLVGGLDRQLYAVDAGSGREKWSFKADNWFWTQPLVDGGVVYAGSLDKKLYALDLASGDPVSKFEFEAESPIRAAPIILDGVLVVADRSGNLYGRDPATGDLVWGDEENPPSLDADVLGHPIQLAERVLFSTQDGDLFLIDPEDGGRQPVTVRGS
ncbi:MAG: PQQ-binding-like beta-propeller repeat protein [Dehalococcoidia bacterium]